MLVVLDAPTTMARTGLTPCRCCCRCCPPQTSFAFRDRRSGGRRRTRTTTATATVREGGRNDDDDYDCSGHGRRDVEGRWNRSFVEGGGDGIGTVEHLVRSPPGPSSADIILGRNLAWKLSSCGDVDVDNGANDEG
jgi:hypothetical protein